MTDNDFTRHFPPTRFRAVDIARPKPLPPPFLDTSPDHIHPFPPTHPAEAATELGANEPEPRRDRRFGGAGAIPIAWLATVLLFVGGGLLIRWWMQ